MTPKVATCCYCSRRTTLVLDAGRHELSCGSCGAPLRRMKMLPVEAVEAAPSRPVRRADPVAGHGAKAKSPAGRPAPRPAKRKRPRGTRWIRMAKKAWDVIEDIFD